MERLTGRSFRLGLAAVALALLPAGALAQEPERLPADTIAFPATTGADTLSEAEPDTARIPLPGVEVGTVEEERGAFPWSLELPGWWGIVVDHYNRVDGLAIGAGVDLKPADPARLPEITLRAALATTHERVYWRAGLRQRLPTPWPLHAKIEHFQRAATFEDWKFSTTENGLTTFLVGRDYLDWWRERGWLFALAAESDRGDFGGTLSLLAADQRSQRNRDPFVLFGDGEFRDVPPVEEGDLRSLTGSVWFDTRDVQSPMLPAAGWRARVELEGAGGVFGGDLDFVRTFVDLRRYVRFGRDTWWDSRLVWLAGDDDEERASDLPPQRLARLGGPGSLRGFDEARFVDDDALQATTELRLPLPVTDPVAVFFLSWHVVGFVDAGAVGDLDEWHADVGTGISGINIFSYLGVFVAQRVTDLDDEDAGPRLVVRLRREF